MRTKLMKKIVSLIFLSILTLAIVFMWYISRSNNEYVKTIPSDSQVLFEINLSDVAKHTGTDFSILQSKLFQNKKTEVGIDFSFPIIGFYTQKGYLGAVAKVKNESDLLTFLQDNDYEIVKQRGYNWCNIEKFLLSFNADKILMLGPCAPWERESMRGEMYALMVQDDNESFLFEKLQQYITPIKIVADASILTQGAASYFDISNPLNEKDLLIVSTLQIKNKELSLNTELVTDNDSLLQYFKEIDSVYCPFNGSEIHPIVSNSFAWMGLNVKGNELLEKLRQIPQIRTALLSINMCVDADMMIKSIDGDVTLSVSEPSFFQPNVLLRAKISNTDFLKNVDDWKTGVSAESYVNFQEHTPTDFSILFNNENYYFGVCNEHLYLTNSINIVQNLKIEGEDKKIETEGCQLFATINVPIILKSLAQYALWMGAPSAVYESLDAVEHFNAKVYNSQHFELELHFDKDIKELIQQIQENN